MSVVSSNQLIDCINDRWKRYLKPSYTLSAKTAVVTGIDDMKSDNSYHYRLFELSRIIALYRWLNDPTHTTTTAAVAAATSKPVVSLSRVHFEIAKLHLSAERYTECA